MSEEVTIEREKILVRLNKLWDDLLNYAEQHDSWDISKKVNVLGEIMYSVESDLVDCEVLDYDEVVTTDPFVKGTVKMVVPVPRDGSTDEADAEDQDG